MRNAHEPSDEFVERLEWQVGREVRRRNRAAEAPSWTPRSRIKLAVAVLGLIVVSMGVGAAAVAAAYESQDSQRRDELTRTLEQRADLARRRLALVTDEQRAVEQRVAVGLANNEEVAESRIKVATAQAQVRVTELFFEEMRLTGREPRVEMSSPRVSGRDFVGERLRAEMSVPETALTIERMRLRDTETRLSVGVANTLDVEIARMRVLEMEVALEGFRRKLDIRQKMLSGAIDAVETELRVLEAEAEQRRRTLQPKVEMGRKEIERIKARVEVGIAANIDLMEATLKQLQLEADLTSADLELAVVRRKIDQHRAGR